MDILFVTSDPALASAVKGTLESARHTVSAASDVDSLAGAWPHGTPMDLVIIDDLSAHDLLDETRRSLSRLMDGCVLSSCYRPVWREFSFRKSGRF